MAQTEQDPIIRLKNVDKFFGDFQALKKVNLEVFKGQKVVVCGPSGSGKSTMIRCINRLESHDGGRILVNGIELNDSLRNIDAVRSEVGMVFQQFNLFPHLTAVGNLMLAPRLVRKKSKAEAREIAMRYLERVHIPEQAELSCFSDFVKDCVVWPDQKEKIRRLFPVAFKRCILCNLWPNLQIAWRF